MDTNDCSILKSEKTRHLCEAAKVATRVSISHVYCIHSIMLHIQSQNASAASIVAGEETSTPESLTAIQVSVSTSIVVSLLDKVLNNS